MQRDTDKFRQLLHDAVIVEYKAKSIRQQEEKSLCSNKVLLNDPLYDSDTS